MPGIDYTLGLRTGGFTSGIRSAMGSLGDLAGTAAKVTAGAAAVTLAGLGAGLAKAIGAAAEQETLETAFIPLLKSVDKARERIAELAKFSSATPFDLPQIAEASKTLETLTGGALATGKGLEMVGDVASGAFGGAMDEAARHVGRLYAALQSGSGGGEALVRLEEVGAISTQARRELERLRDAGGGAAAWKAGEAALGKFTGAMALQSQTWGGLMSTLKDEWNNVLVTIGKPVIGALKPFLEDAIGLLQNFQGQALNIGEGIAGQVGILRAALGKGQLMEVMGEGLKLAGLEAVNAILKGMSAVMDVLRSSGIMATIEAAFLSIGEKFSAVLYRAAAEIAGSFGNFIGESQLRGSERQSEQRGETYAGVAQAGVKNFIQDLGEALGDLPSAYKAQPDMKGVEEARRNYATLVAPLRAEAEAEKARREASLRANAESYANRRPAPNLKELAPVKVPEGAGAEGGGGPQMNWLERLGFLGVSTSDRENAVMREGIKHQLRTSELLENIYRLLATPSSEGARF